MNCWLTDWWLVVRQSDKLLADLLTGKTIITIIDFSYDHWLLLILFLPLLIFFTIIPLRLNDTIFLTTFIIGWRDHGLQTNMTVYWMIMRSTTKKRDCQIARSLIADQIAVPCISVGGCAEIFPKRETNLLSRFPSTKNKLILIIKLTTHNYESNQERSWQRQSTRSKWNIWEDCRSSEEQTIIRLKLKL